MTRDFDDISGPDMAEWCALLADDNQIHLTREAAEAAGFGPRRVNPGPANLAYLMTLVSEDLAHVDARFSGNVFEGDDLTASAAPTDEGAEARLTRDGETLLTALFKVRP